MASKRYYHGGPDALDVNQKADESGYVNGDPQRDKFTEDLKKHHPLSRPNRENMAVVAGEPHPHIKVPPMFCTRVDYQGKMVQETLPYPPGSISIGLPGYNPGFYVIPPGGYIDIDVDVPEKVIKGMAPHLLNEAEYLARKPVEAAPAAPAAPQPQRK